MVRRLAGMVVSVLSISCMSAAVVPAQAPPPAEVASVSRCAEMEAYLKSARVVRRQAIPVGVTLPTRVTLDDGQRRHDAAIQQTDIRKPSYSTPRGTELNFRDAWQFNVAGYEVAKILELNMVPPYVERSLSGILGSVSWWVIDAMMDRDRFEKKIRPPDLERWNREMYAVYAFRALIGDVDLNRTNLLITKDWRLWMIDFSRAFRLTTNLPDAKQLVAIDRKLLANLRELHEDALRQKLARWVGRSEIRALLARRDLIVGHFEAAIAAKGEDAVLYDFPRTSEPCGAGLS